MIKEPWPSVIAIASMCVAGLAFWIAASYFEARSYERVTGKHVSTFDAMFVDLRVQEQVK